MKHWFYDNYTVSSSTQVEAWIDWRGEKGRENPPAAGVREPRRPVPSSPPGHLALEHAPT